MNASHQHWKGQLRVAAISRETHDVKTFHLTAADNSCLPFEFLPGQFLTVHMTLHGKHVNRAYSIASSPAQRDGCDVTVKREERGLVSCWLHDELKPGDMLQVTAPFGEFVFTGEGTNRVLLIGGGLGIVPLMSIVRWLTDRNWSGEIWLVMVARTEDDLVYRDEILRRQQQFSSLHVCTTLTRCGPDSSWNGARGRLSETLLRRCVPDLTDLPAYLCGPDEMVAATRSLLLSLGTPESAMHTERFG